MPYVVKTDGLAAGKGVLVTDSWEEAAAAIKAQVEKGAVVVEKADSRLYTGGITEHASGALIFDDLD